MSNCFVNCKSLKKSGIKNRVKKYLKALVIKN